MTSVLSVLSELIPLTAGIAYWKRSDRAMRLLTGLILYGVINFFALLIAAVRYGNNMVLLHIYTLVSYTLVALILAQWNARTAARVMRASVPLLGMFYLVLVVTGYEQFMLPNKATRLVGTLLVGLMLLYTIFKTLRSHADSPLYRDERFWVLFGLFFVYAGNAFVYSGIMQYITHSIWQVHSMLNIVANLLFFKGYLCLRR